MTHTVWGASSCSDYTNYVMAATLWRRFFVHFAMPSYWACGCPAHRELQCSYYTDRIVRVTITVRNCEKWQDAVLAIKSFPLINAPWTLYSLESSDWTHGHSRFHANMNKMGEWNDCTDHFRLRHCNWLNPVLQIVPKQTLFICRAYCESYNGQDFELNAAIEHLFIGINLILINFSSFLFIWFMVRIIWATLQWSRFFLIKQRVFGQFA